MLGEGFRRQLLMDGQYGSLAFIATHSDIVNRSELIRNLDLPRDTSITDCARARNDYTKRRYFTCYATRLNFFSESKKTFALD